MDILHRGRLTPNGGPRFTTPFQSFLRTLRLFAGLGLLSDFIVPVQFRWGERARRTLRFQPELRSWFWGARPPRAQRTAPSRFAGLREMFPVFRIIRRLRVRREGAPNCSRGGCALHFFQGILLLVPRLFEALQLDSQVGFKCESVGADGFQGSHKKGLEARRKSDALRSSMRIAGCRREARVRTGEARRRVPW